MLRYQLTILAALIAIITCPFSAYASYSRTPAGDTVYQDDGMDLHYDLSGYGTGYYASFFTGSVIGSCVHVTSDPQSIDEHISSPTLGAYTEIFIVRWSDSGCTSYVGATSIEYDAGATIFTVVEGSGGGGGGGGDGATTTEATSTVEQTQTNTFNGFIIFFVTMFFIVWSFKKRT